MNRAMEQIVEHNIYKSVAPLVLAALIGSTGWLFMSIIELQSQVRLITEGKIISLSEDVEDLELEVKDLQDDMSETKINNRLIEKVQILFDDMMKRDMIIP